MNNLRNILEGIKTLNPRDGEQDPSGQTDDEIVLDGGFILQVGSTYLILNHYEEVVVDGEEDLIGNLLGEWSTGYDVDAIVKEILTAINEWNA